MEPSDWDARYAGQELVWSAEPNRFVEEVCSSLPPGRALDLAAGEGRNAIWLAGLGWEVTAVDFSGVALEKGRRLAEHQGEKPARAVTWTQADVRTWAPPAADFDLVIISYLHLPAGERRQVLAHAVSGLAPGGLLLVVGHDIANLSGGIGGPQDPSVLYGPGDVVADLAPLVEVAVERAATVERPTQSGNALDVLVTARRVPAGR